MMLVQTTASFLDYIRRNESFQLQLPRHEEALRLLTDYFSPNSTLSDITAEGLRNFLARWYVEKPCTRKRSCQDSTKRDLPFATRATGDYEVVNTQHAGSDASLEPDKLLASLADFFNWADQENGTDLTARSSPVLIELSRTLPRALEITDALSTWLRERGGAFSFPEFLTSFEEGGRSQYDIDAPSDVGAIEGYFRIVRVEGSLVEAEELICGERVWPIAFPAEVATRLDDRYIINLELVRTPEGWQIAGCGFTYPPGTEV